jgi:hypothetical protein
MLHINVGKSGDTSLLEINVEIDGAKMKPVKNGAATVAPKPAPVMHFDPNAPAPWVKQS